VFNQKLYIPRAAEIDDIKSLTYDTTVYTMKFKSDEADNEHDFKPGQFVQVSILGAGEAPISICSSPTQKGNLQLCIRKAGRVTGATAELKKGDELGIRGPYGNHFPIEEIKGQDLIFIAGGIGLAPLRSVINYVLDEKKDYGQVTILYGARTVDDIVFADELQKWAQTSDVEVLTTIDTPQKGWSGHVGVVTTLIEKIKDKNESKAFVCGPPIMIHFTIKELLDRDWSEDNIITTLERHMKCGVGKCGHCYIGGKYVCTDGPVFTYGQIKQINAGV